MTNDKWNDDNKGVRHLANPPVAWSRAKYDQIQDRWALPLGGPFWKDHLWFFGAYEWYDQTSPFSQTATTTNPVTTGTGQSYQQTLNVKLYDGKLTLQATPSHLLTGTINSDPITGFAVDYWGQFGLPAAERRALTLQGQNDCGGICTWSGRWSGVFGSNISAEALYAQQKSDITVTNFEGNGSPYINLTDGLVYNGGAFDGFVRRPRKQGNLAVNLYQQLFGNSHQFKVGVDYQDLQSIASFIYPGNQEFVVTNYDPVTRQPVLSPGDQRLDFTTPQASTSTGKIWGFYALDKFEVGKNLFFNVGFRVDKQDAKSDLHNTVLDSTTFSPRITGVYDLFANGKTLFSAAYGRYYQFVVQNLADSVYAGVAQQSNYDLYEWDGTQFVLTDMIRVGGNTQPVNNSLKPSYLDEFNVAFQQQLGNTMAFGIRGI